MSTLLSTAFDSDTAGTLPLGWVNVTGVWTVRAYKPVSGANALGEAAGAVGDVVLHTGVAAKADASMLYSQLVQWNGSAGACAGVILRANSASYTNAYLLTFSQWANGGNATGLIFKRVAGSYTQINSTSKAMSLADGDTAKVRFECNGSTIRWKLWETGSEPATWDASITDTSVTAAGYPGFFFGNVGTGTNGGMPAVDDITYTDFDSYTVTGPTTGGTSVASTDITITLGSAQASDITFTPSGTVGTVNFTPSTITITAGNLTGSCKATPTSDGAHVITFTNSGPLTNPAGFTYTTATGQIYTRINAVGAVQSKNIMCLVPNANATTPYASGAHVVMYHHGRGEDEAALLTDSLKTACRNALLNAGYVLIGTADSATGWGIQASVDAYADADKWLQDNFTVGKRVLWGQSMGGLSALLSAAQRKVKDVVGLLLTYPVCSLSSMYNGGAGTYASEITASHGITNSADQTYAKKTYGLDPLLLDPVSFRGAHVRAYHSSGDTVVGKTANTDALNTAIASSSKSFTVIATTGNHGDASNFVASEYTAFVAAAVAAPPSTTGLVGSGGTSGATRGRVVNGA